MSKEPSYALAVGKHDEERLQILNEVYNPSTLAFFKNSGIKPGMSILDVGCGTGIISCELAKIVGPHGRVTCIDISPDQLDLAKEKAEQQNLSNIEFICLSAYEVDKLKQKFDIVSCRFLLMHLKEPARVIDQFLSILNEDGLLFLEESLGIKTLDCLPEKIPTFELFFKIAETQYSIQQSDSSIGRLLPQMVIDKGLHLKNLELCHPILKTAREKSLLRLGIASSAQSLKEHDVLFDEQKLMSDLREDIENNDRIQILYPELCRICAYHMIID